MAIDPLQVHPVKEVDNIVGNLVGANAVGDAEDDAVGEVVGEAEGAKGQFVIPCLNAHNALASVCCVAAEKENKKYSKIWDKRYKAT
jgi:hypothetical protein